MNGKQIITVGIASYNNYNYLNEAVDSVLNQDYPYIELIISNDASQDFDEDEIKEYIEHNKKDNIIHYIINNNETNQGTVRNVNFIRKNATGEFLMLMAADDALFDEHVLSRFVEEFNRLGENAYVVSAQTAMCGKTLDKIKSYEPNEEGIRAIKELTPEEMFSRLSHTFTIPTTSTCYRMSLYDLVGPYNEEYFIIEDAPLYLKMARMGLKFHWADDFVAAKHRDGGISHGNKKNTSESYRKYRYDEVLIFKNEILPYQDQIGIKDKQIMQKKWEYLKQAYDHDFSLTGGLDIDDSSIMGRFKKNFIWIFKLQIYGAVCMVIPYLLLYFNVFNGVLKSHIINGLQIYFAYGTIFFFILSGFLIILRELYYAILIIKKIYRKIFG